jgi:hypothetical protein
MGVAYNSRIVTDGLVLALDAGNTKSYPGSGTTWTDLSGFGRNGTLTNMEIPGDYSSSVGYFDFSLDEWVDCSLSSGLTGTSSWTMEAWFKVNGAPSNVLWQNVIVDTDATGSSANMIAVDYGGYHGGSQNQLVYTSRPSTGGSYTNLLGPVLTQGVWYYASAVRNGTTDTKLYTNGTLSSTYSGDIPTATQPLVRIARWTDGTGYSNVSISSVKIYNRALTASEVQQNFNANRSRFGI